MSALTISRAEAAKRLQTRIDKGEELLNAQIGSTQELAEARKRYYTWDEYNEELLRKLFTKANEAEAYSGFVGGVAFVVPTTFGESIAEYHDDVSSKLRRLASVVERLELFDEPPSTTGAAPDPESQESIARRLIETLKGIEKSKFQDSDLIQEAKTLNARLGPTYVLMYGGIPEITTTYPARVWFPRALDFAENALAAASADDQAAVTRTPTPPPRLGSDRVFIVHGHDPGLKEAVARLIDRLGYTPVILHERPDRGQTIIEKFEQEAPDAAFAVILLTPDDEGRLRALGEEDATFPLLTRARQNVVWEFGYFTALLGRANVAALVFSEERMERPSDLDGLLYITVQQIEDEGWRWKLAREMKEAGLEIDLNKVG